MDYLKQVFIKLVIITTLSIVAFLCAQLLSPGQIHFPNSDAKYFQIHNRTGKNSNDPFENNRIISANYTSPNVTLSSVLSLFSDKFAKLEEYRQTFLTMTKAANSTFLTPGLRRGQYSVRVIGPGYFENLKRYEGIRTVNFSASLETINSFWPYKFFKQAVSKKVIYRNKHLPFQFHENLTWENTVRASKHYSEVIQTTNVAQDYNSTNVLLTFIHIIRNGIVFSEGIVAHSNIHLNQKACKYESYKKANSDQLPMHDEVFTISEFWGEGFFHSTIENIPRLAMYVEFLRQHPSILIHCRTKSLLTVNFIRQFGLSNSVVTGHVKAKIIYMPAGVACGQATTFPSFITNLRLRQIVEMPYIERKLVIVIQRSSRRWFGRHKDIWNMLKKYEPKYGYKLEIFSDRHMPSFQETMLMFNRAIMVIGPHGAGLSNIFFSQPGTIVIEGLCKELNFCYSRLAFVLGDIYYGVIPEIDCRTTTPEMIAKAILPYFDWLKSTKQL